MTDEDRKSLQHVREWLVARPGLGARATFAVDVIDRVLKTPTVTAAALEPWVHRFASQDADEGCNEMDARVSWRSTLRTMFADLGFEVRGDVPPPPEGARHEMRSDGLHVFPPGTVTATAVSNPHAAYCHATVPTPDRPSGGCICGAWKR